PLCIFIYCYYIGPTTTYVISTLSLHDALPIFHALRQGSRALSWPRHARQGARVAGRQLECPVLGRDAHQDGVTHRAAGRPRALRSEEHTSELQSRENLVCRLLLEKKNKTKEYI